jgi:hypothetical protein
MFHIRVDLIKNRLYLTLGCITKNKVDRALLRIEQAARKLDPGFTCVTRIIDYREIDASDIDGIKSIQKRLLTCGMSRMVRVGHEPGRQFLHLVGTELQGIAQDADNLEEAESLLDETACPDMFIPA